MGTFSPRPRPPRTCSPAAPPSPGQVRRALAAASHQPGGTLAADPARGAPPPHFWLSAAGPQPGERGPGAVPCPYLCAPAGRPGAAASCRGGLLAKKREKAPCHEGPARRRLPPPDIAGTGPGRGRGRDGRRRHSRPAPSPGAGHFPPPRRGRPCPAPGRSRRGASSRQRPPAAGTRCGRRGHGARRLNWGKAAPGGAAARSPC